MGKAFPIAIIAVLAIMIGIFMFVNDGSGPDVAIDDPHEIETGVDHTIGPDDAPVTLVKYSDFQCPACQSAHSILQDVRDEFDDGELQFVYRHSPFLSQAFDAARASEAAANQDAFWEMHDLLFAHQSEWSGATNARDLFDGYAEELDLDVEQFRSDFVDVSDRVERDAQIRNELEVTATPTYFINGQQLEQNPGSADAFIEIIESQLAQAQAETDEDNDGAADETAPVREEE